MKLNPSHAIFDRNMFVQLEALLDPIVPPSDLPVIDMSIGEPQQPPATLLTKSVSRYNEEWQFYPKATGSPQFTKAVETYIAQRWPKAAGLAKAVKLSQFLARVNHFICWDILSPAVRKMRSLSLQTRFIMRGGQARWPAAVKSFI